MKYIIELNNSETFIGERQTESKLNGDINKFNSSIPDKIRVDNVSLDEFRDINKNAGMHSLEGLIKNAFAAGRNENGVMMIFKGAYKFVAAVATYDGDIYKINMTNGGIDVHYDEDCITCKINGKRNKSNGMDSKGRLRISNLMNYNSSTFAEKLIGLVDAFLCDQFPSTFKGLVINVMNGTGNRDTAKKLGVDVNLKEDQLEWTSKKRNSEHGGRIIHMKKITGHVYCWSANDMTLDAAMDLKNDDYIKKYMHKNYKTIY